MIDDQDLGRFTSVLGVVIMILLIAYHYVAANPKFEAQQAQAAMHQQ